jgi:hypothetical protein
VTRLALAAKVIPGWYSGNKWHVPAITEVVRREAAITREKPIVTADFAALVEPPHKVLCMATVKAGLTAMRGLAKRLQKVCTAAFSHDSLLEITPAGVSKATALAEVCRALRISREHTPAIGDSENDIAMVAGAGIGIAMGNAIPSVKRVADWITGTNEGGGVAQAIDRFRLIAAGRARHRKERSMATTFEAAAARKRSCTDIFKASGLIWAFVLLCVAAAIISPTFLNPFNLVNVLRQIALFGIVSIGLTFVILTRGIDLSVGSLVGVVAVATALLLSAGVPILVTILLALMIGAALGALNGAASCLAGCRPSS